MVDPFVVSVTCKRETGLVVPIPTSPLFNTVSPLVDPLAAMVEKGLVSVTVVTHWSFKVCPVVATKVMVTPSVSVWAEPVMAIPVVKVPEFFCHLNVSGVPVLSMMTV